MAPSSLVLLCFLTLLAPRWGSSFPMPEGKEHYGLTCFLFILNCFSVPTTRDTGCCIFLSRLLSHFVDVEGFFFKLASFLSCLTSFSILQYTRFDLCSFPSPHIDQPSLFRKMFLNIQPTCRCTRFID